MQELLSNDFMSQERKYARWKINGLFFLLSASYVTLWPWVPLMFFNVGCTLTKIGLFVCLLHIFSLISVKLSLLSIASTKSGCVRRVILFSFAALSFAFGLTALVLIPVPQCETFCSPFPIMYANVPPENITNQLLQNRDEVNIDVRNKVIHSSNNTILHTPADKLANIPKKNRLKIVKPSSNNRLLHKTKSIHHITNKSRVSHLKTITNSSVKDTKQNGINETHIANKKSHSSDNHKKAPKHHIKLSENQNIDYDYYDPYEYEHERSRNQYPLRKFLLQMDSINGIPTQDEEEFHNSRLSIFPIHSSQNNFGTKIKSIHHPKSKRSVRDKKKHIFANDTKVSSDFERNKTIKTTFDRITKRFKDIKKLEHNKTEFSSLLVFGIVSTLALSMILGGGLEIAINNLWHCSVYGVPHDNGLLDGIEYSGSSPSKLPFIGTHKVWFLCTSCAWLFLITVTILLSCNAGLTMSPFKILSAFFFVSELLKCITLLIIYMPYGDLSIQAANRTLGLYLDNEVIEEGLRRISFHAWIFISGIILSLPTLYTILLIQEVQASQKEIWIAQTAAISSIILGEAVILMSDRWFSGKFNLQAMIGLTGLLIAVQNVAFWKATSIWVKSASAILVGFAKSATFISISINAQTLGTSEDQKKESWISWICLKCGLGVGSVIWMVVADTEWALYSLNNLLPVSAVFAIIISCVSGLTAMFYRRKKKSKRIYHTLDIGGTSDDDTDDSEINTNEEDWLVKRAKKEGFQL